MCCSEGVRKHSRECDFACMLQCYSPPCRTLQCHVGRLAASASALDGKTILVRVGRFLGVKPFAA